MGKIKTQGTQMSKKKEKKVGIIRKRLLSLQIAVSIVLVVIILTVIQSSLSFNSMNKSTEYALKSSLINMAQETALQIETQIKYYTNEAKAVGNLLCREEMSDQDRKDTLSFTQSRYDFSKIVFTDANGVGLSDKVDYASSEIYQQAVKNGQALSDAVLVNGANGVSEYNFQVSVPVITNGLPSGSRQGVILATLSNDALSNMLRKIEIGEHGRAFIINKNADIIASVSLNEDSGIRTPETFDQNNVPSDLKDIYSKMIVLEPGQTDIGNYADKNSAETIYIGYAPIENSPGWSVGIYAVKSDFFSEGTRMTKLNIVLAALFVFVSLIIGQYISTIIIKPIQKITCKMNKFAQLDMTKDEPDRRLAKRQDEIGVMNTELEKMRTNINEFMKQIQDTSGIIDENAEKLELIAKKTYDSSSDNSGTTEELSASMQEATATTEEIKADIFNILKSVNEVTEKSVIGKELAGEIKVRADRLKSSNFGKTEKANKLFTDVKKRSDSALLQANAITKIDELTNIIKTVAEQTNLLSLNASIEAARAGEHGKGFAVVASEIRQLAGTVSKTAIEIEKIISETVSAVEGLADCLGQSIDFIEGTAIKDLKEIVVTGDQYGKDADSIKDMLVNINESMELLNEITKQMTDSAAGINTIMEQSALGVADIAQKTSEVVNLSNETNQMAERSMDNARSLKEIVGNFRLDSE